MGLFADWQPVYDDMGLATFPVDPRKKKPLEKAPAQIGRPRSRVLAAKYPDASAFGFMCGPRNALTVLDIDSPDDKILADCLAKLGDTPLIGRTPSGGFHAYYRHNGERRSPRALARSWGLGDCIDVLGFNGLCIAPPSLTGKGSYELIEGDLGDLARLPKMRPIVPANDVPAKRDVTPCNAMPGGGLAQGQRNNGLWRAAMRTAKEAQPANLEAFMPLVAALNRELCQPLLPGDEVARIASSVWAKTAAGDNWLGAGRKLVQDMDAVQDHIARDSDGFALLTYLRCQHASDKTFYVANAMRAKFGWGYDRFTKARGRLVKEGHLLLVSSYSVENSTSYLFKFAPK